MPIPLDTTTLTRLVASAREHLNDDPDQVYHLTADDLATVRDAGEFLSYVARKHDALTRRWGRDPSMLDVLAAR